MKTINLVIFVLLAACSAFPKPAPTPTPTAIVPTFTPTSTSTPEPSPTPTETPTATPVPVYTATDAVIAFRDAGLDIGAPSYLLEPALTIPGVDEVITFTLSACDCRVLIFGFEDEEFAIDAHRPFRISREQSAFRSGRVVLVISELLPADDDRVYANVIGALP